MWDRVRFDARDSKVVIDDRLQLVVVGESRVEHTAAHFQPSAGASDDADSADIRYVTNERDWRARVCSCDSPYRVA
jgi:hypothetical protein